MIFHNAYGAVGSYRYTVSMYDPVERAHVEIAKFKNEGSANIFAKSMTSLWRSTGYRNELIVRKGKRQIGRYASFTYTEIALAQEGKHSYEDSHEDSPFI